MILCFDELKQNKRNRLVFQAKSALFGGDRAQVRHGGNIHPDKV